MKANRNGWHDAEYWDRREDGRASCRLCPHHCVIKEGQSGLCNVRGVRGGELKALGYGILSSAHVDPVEKKPLYHFFPGASIFSIGGWGCNFGCVFCQNWAISQKFAESEKRYLPIDIVSQVRASDCKLVAYTYNEPLVGFEFVRDCCRLTRQAGYRNVLVTNGYVEEAPAAEMLPLVDALNVDIKSMEDEFYRKQCRGSLDPVLRFCRQAAKAGCHIEITNLVIPTLNDREELFRQLARWIQSELGPDVPLHLSAYRPEFRSTIPPTPPETLAAASRICREELQYVYLGNVWGMEGQDTCCPGCGNLLLSRRGYTTRRVGVRDGQCRQCGRKADIIDE